MNFFAKLAELSDGTISELKWIVLFLSCIAFLVSLLALKSSKENVLKAITYSSVVSFAVAACGFVYSDILDMVCKLIGYDTGVFITIIRVLLAIPALISAVGFVLSFEDTAESFYNKIHKGK